MAKKNTAVAKTTPKDTERTPACVAIANRGIKNSQDFTNFFATLIADLTNQRITPSYANAMSNAGGKITKMVELEIRYGKDVPTQDNGRKCLTIQIESPVPTPESEKQPASSVQ